MGLLCTRIRAPGEYTPGTTEGGKGAWGRPTAHPHSRPRRVHARNYMRGSVYRMPSRMAANCPMGPCVYREIEKYTPILLHTGRVPAWGAKVL